MTHYNEFCPIWGTPASIERPNGGFLDNVDSPRAGGKFLVDGALKTDLKQFSVSQKVALTDWLVKQRRIGIKTPKVDDLKRWKNIPKAFVVDRMNRAIIWIGNTLNTPGDKLCLGNDFTMMIMDTELSSVSHENAPYFFAAIGSATTDDDEGILRLLNDAGYLRPPDGSSFKARSDLYMTPKGWEKYAELSEHGNGGATAFVAMWFDKSMDDVYDNGFSKAIEDAGYEPIRIDHKEHNNKIDDEIVAEIRRSKFIVADFTSEIVDRKSKSGELFKDTHARGGVYFEAGFAKGLGKEVIWTVRKDVIDAQVLHFDTRQFAHIVWKDATDLRMQLSRRISATMGDGPNKKPA